MLHVEKWLPLPVARTVFRNTASFTSGLMLVPLPTPNWNNKHLCKNLSEFCMTICVRIHWSLDSAFMAVTNQCLFSKITSRGPIITEWMYRLKKSTPFERPLK